MIDRMALLSVQNVAFPVAHWVDRMILMRKVRRRMTSTEYIAYCKSATPITVKA